MLKVSALTALWITVFVIFVVVVIFIIQFIVTVHVHLQADTKGHNRFILRAEI